MQDPPSPPPAGLEGKPPSPGIQVRSTHDFPSDIAAQDSIPLDSKLSISGTWVCRLQCCYVTGAVEEAAVETPQPESKTPQLDSKAEENGTAANASSSPVEPPPPSIAEPEAKPETATEIVPEAKQETPPENPPATPEVETKEEKVEVKAPEAAVEEDALQKEASAPKEEPALPVQVPKAEPAEQPPAPSTNNITVSQSMYTSMIQCIVP